VLGTVADDNSRMGAGPVLVVDDYEPAVESTCRLLKIIRHDAVACTDATKCVEIAKQIQPGAVLLDIQMPVISGLELVGLLREVIGPDCKIIAVTGHVNREMERRCLSAGFDAFIVKPTMLRDLEAVIGVAEIRDACE